MSNPSASFASLPPPRPLAGEATELGAEFSPAEHQERLAWLALVLTPGLGPRRILQAVERYGTAFAVIRLAPTELEAQRFPATAVQHIAGGGAWKAAQEEAARLKEMGASYLTYSEELYPPGLKEIYDPPPVLWYRGQTILLRRPALAVVGTRQPSPYGSGMAELLSRDLALRGLIIASGMARGIDAFAHKGAIATGQPTIAVWGTGIDVIYPKENKALAEKILATHGLILTEQPLGTYPAPPNFPKRNRILSGISCGVLVIEAAEYSGSRVTARCAIEQNRDVYAVPGNVTNKNSWGPNTLIKQGATLVATWEDVYEALPTPVRVAIDALETAGGPGFESGPAGSASLFNVEDLPPAQAALMCVLRHDESLQMDEILEQLEPEQSSSEVFTALFELELAGRIKQLPGKNYVKCF